MKYLKSYKVFESVGKINFPTYNELHDFFVELEDDEITKFNYKDDNNGYLFFPQKWDIHTKSTLYYDMTWKEKNWHEEKPYDLLGDAWSDFFLDPVTYRDKAWLRRRAEWINMDDVKSKRTNVKQLGGEGKTFEELFIENVERGLIKAFPFIYCSFNIFDPKHLDLVIERLKMVYEATDFRPLFGFWKEDFVDEDNGDVITLINSNLYLVNVTDEEYKNLIEIFNDHKLDKQVTNHFI